MSKTEKKSGNICGYNEIKKCKLLQKCVTENRKEIRLGKEKYMEVKKREKKVFKKLAEKSRDT